MRVTTFDFDVCGPGWLAFDIARWRDKTHDKPTAAWDAFLDGYRSERALTAADRDAIELFETLQLFDWTRVKFTFAARGAWDSWDADFFLNDLLDRLKRNEAAILAGPQRVPAPAAEPPEQQGMPFRPPN